MFRKLLESKRQVIPVDTLTGYAQWAKSYPAYAHNLLMQLEEQAMLSLLPDPAGKICLDLACGSGRYMRQLQLRKAKQVIGLDYSAHMLIQAKAAASRTNDGAATNGAPPVQLTRSPFLALPFASQRFDLITCGLAVGHEQNLERLLAEASRLLRVGGAIVYSDFHPFQALSGGRRTFTTDRGAILELEHYIHLYHHHQQASQSAGLTIDGIREPTGGNIATRERIQEIPVVLVIRATKTKSDERKGR